MSLPLAVFSLDNKGRKGGWGEKCSRLLPQRCDVAPGEAKSSLSFKEKEGERKKLALRGPGGAGKGSARMHTHIYTHTRAHTNTVFKGGPEIRAKGMR